MNVSAQTTAETSDATIKAQSIISGTFVTTDIARMRRMCEEALGLECVVPKKGVLLIRERGHRSGEKLAGQPYWVLEAHEVEKVDVPQEMLNHWGVFVSSREAVDEANAKLTAAQAEYGIKRVQSARPRHGSYSFYFIDADSNWWEIEYRTPDLLYTTLRDKGDQH